MQVITLRYRIKDSTSAKKLNRMARSVSYVWNYCNSINIERWAKFRKAYSEYEFHKMTSGCSKNLGISSATINAVCSQFSNSRRGKIKLSWRSVKRSLGWIPFKNQVSATGDVFTYFGEEFRFWLSRPIEGKIKCGSFSQDAQGHWYVNLTIESADVGRIKTGREAGVDLGLKTLLTLSDGKSITRPNLTIKYAQRLAIAQRANKKRQVKKIHAKIKNSRKDFNHKTSTELVRNYDSIYDVPDHFM